MNNLEIIKIMNKMINQTKYIRRVSETYNLKKGGL